MKKEDYEVTDLILRHLGECPNCNGELRKFKDYKLRCNCCGMDIFFESRQGRLLTWGFMGVVLVFAVGYLVATFL